MIVSTVAIAIIIVYLVLIGSLTYAFDKIEAFKLRDLKPKNKFSVIIPFRDEAEHLPKLLESIYNLNYPKDSFEVILVDDESTDDSIAVIEKIINTIRFKQNTRTDIQIISNHRISNSPKKDAITSAISISKFEWIITTDADCILPKYWLDTFDEYIQTTNPNCIVAPVTYHINHSFFNRFQTLDILSLQGASIGGFGLGLPFLCNGANFAYRKSVFISLNGFQGNTEIASGDDIFLLEKFKKQDQKKVAYLKSLKAVVSTNPVSGFKKLIQQRLRWASKTSHNPNWFSKGLGLVVFLGNFVCTLLIPLALLNLISTKTAVALFVIKFGVDFLLLSRTSRFFKQEALLTSYIYSSLLYPFFSVYIVVLSLFKSYSWKGRTFRK